MIRKWMVSLKRRPQMIPLLMLCGCCCLYTFNLTVHSNATMYVSSRIIALYVFIITLASILTIFSYMNAYARKNRQKWYMHAVVYVLILTQIGFDLAYWQVMYYEVFLRDNPVPLTSDISKSMNGTMSHLICLAITMSVALLVPVYHKLLLKIDTSVEDNEDTSYDDEALEVEDDF